MTTVTAEVNLSVSEPITDSGNVKIAMNIHTISTSTARILHTPAVNSIITLYGAGRLDFAPKGTHYQDYEEVIEFNNAEIAQASSSDECATVVEEVEIEASLAYYASGIITIEVIYAVGWGGLSVSPSLHFSMERQKLIADIPFDGAVFVKYKTSYFFFDYYPEISILTGGGVQANWGRIFAYYNTTKAQLSFPSFQFEQRNQFEICAVTSEYVANEDGQWEKPDDWPDNPSYSDGSEAPDAEGSQLLERQHRVWFIIPDGSVRWSDFNRSTLRPFSAHSSYQPVYSFRINSPPTEAWAKKAFNRVNFGDIRKEVNYKYNITNCNLQIISRKNLIFLSDNSFGQLR